jgi:hypothetical protein
MYLPLFLDCKVLFWISFTDVFYSAVHCIRILNKLHPSNTLDAGVGKVLLLRRYSGARRLVLLHLEHPTYPCVCWDITRLCRGPYGKHHFIFPTVWAPTQAALDTELPASGTK